MSSIRKTVFPFLLLAMLSCDPSYRTVIRVASMNQAHCQDTQFVFDYLDYNKRYDEETKFVELRPLMAQDNLIDIHRGTISSPPDWAMLKIRCPQSNELIFDSGKVNWKTGFYEAGFLRYFFYLDGPPKGKGK